MRIRVTTDELQIQSCGQAMSGDIKKTSVLKWLSDGSIPREKQLNCGLTTQLNSKAIGMQKK